MSFLQRRGAAAYKGVFREPIAQMMVHQQRLYLSPVCARWDNCSASTAAMIEHDRVLWIVFAHSLALDLAMRVGALAKQMDEESVRRMSEGNERAVHNGTGREPVRIFVRDNESF